MQNTRLNTLWDDTTQRLGGWLRNPWRRISTMIISLLFGNFLATALSTVSGQRATLDISICVTLVLITELVSWLAYSRRPVSRTFTVEWLNAMKIGFTYGLFVEAFKLGS